MHNTSCPGNYEVLRSHLYQQLDRWWRESLVERSTWITFTSSQPTPFKPMKNRNQIPSYVWGLCYEMYLLLETSFKSDIHTHIHTFFFSWRQMLYNERVCLLPFMESLNQCKLDKCWKHHSQGTWMQPSWMYWAQCYLSLSSCV